MDWKEIQTAWKEEGNHKSKEFSIPSKSRLESLGREMKYFQQDYGRTPSLWISAIFLLFSGMLLFGILRDGFDESENLDYFIFLFLPLAIFNLLRAILSKNVSPSENLLDYLKHARKNVRLVRIQQLASLSSLLFLIPLLQSARKGFTWDDYSNTIGLLLFIPIALIFAAVLWWYQSQHPYNLSRLLKELNALIKEMEEEEKS